MSARLQRGLRGLLLAAVALLAALYLARDAIARRAAEVAVRRATGFPLEVGWMHLDLLGSRIDARGIALLNPPEFPERLFVHLPRLQVAYRPASLLRAPHLENVSVELRRIVVVTNNRGVSNVRKLQDALGTSNRRTSYRVDTLHLQIGTVSYVGGTRSGRTVPLNVDVTYQNVTDATSITRLAFLAIMSKVRLPDVDLGELKRGLGNAASGAGTTNA
jgi:hypothetical protein